MKASCLTFVSAAIPTLAISPSKSWRTDARILEPFPVPPLALMPSVIPVAFDGWTPTEPTTHFQRQKSPSAASTTHLAYGCSDSSDSSPVVCSTVRISVIGCVSPRYRDCLSTRARTHVRTLLPLLSANIQGPLRVMGAPYEYLPSTPNFAGRNVAPSASARCASTDIQALSYTTSYSSRPSHDAALLGFTQHCTPLQP